MDLNLPDLDGVIPDLGGSHAPGPPNFVSLRALSEADWLMPRGAKPPPLKELRRSHHEVARLLAQGCRPAEVAAQTGYAPSRISILQNDPAFRELVAFYNGRREELSEGVSDRLRLLTLDTLEVLHERVREEPAEVSTAELRSVAELGLDRIGHGKASKSVSVQVSMSAEEISELRKSLISPRVISPAEFLEGAVAAAGTSDSEEAGATPGNGLVDGAAELREGTEATRPVREGAVV